MQKSGNRVRVEGRTRTVFENGTYSNMLYRSLGKQIQKDGKLITKSIEKTENELFVNSGVVNEVAEQTGWVYVLKSKSTNPNISNPLYSSASFNQLRKEKYKFQFLTKRYCLFY